jgi:hypothetical protein
LLVGDGLRKWKFVVGSDGEIFAQKRGKKPSTVTCGSVATSVRVNGAVPTTLTRYGSQAKFDAIPASSLSKGLKGKYNQLCDLKRHGS